MTKKTINVPEKDLPITPLTLEKMEEAAQKRIDKIAKEFKDGFDLIRNHPASVTFFGSARLPEDNKYYIQARNLAQKIATEIGYSVLTGGGPGIMEAANRGAYESGGRSLGLNIELPKEQALNPYVTEQVQFKYFFSRKVCLSFSAEAYIFFPGGFGTMDEFFEILTLVQTKKIEAVPIILVGKDYWNPLKTFINETLLQFETIDEADTHLYSVIDDNDLIVDIIKQTPVKRGTHKMNKEEVEIPTN